MLGVHTAQHHMQQ